MRINWRWAALITVGMTATVVGSLAVVETLGRARAGDGMRALPDLEIQADREVVEDRAGFLSESPGALLDEAIKVLKAYAGARSADVALAEVRTAQRGRAEDFNQHWVAWANPPLLENRRQVNYAIATTFDPPFMMIWGLKADYSRFCAYFVRENGRLRIDWEATEMFSDIPIDKLPGNPPSHPVLVRCEAQDKPFYTMSLPEERYRSYLIENPNTHEFVWGYAERNGEVDMKLQGALIAGSAFQKHSVAQRVIVKLDTPGRRETNSQFLITEMLHIEWVLP